MVKNLYAIFCHFYPRPPRGGRPLYYNHDDKKSRISIHALREEGDQGVVRQDAAHLPISIHALREEGDQQCTSDSIGHGQFLSTPSARRATFTFWHSSAPPS